MFYRSPFQLPHFDNYCINFLEQDTVNGVDTSELRFGTFFGGAQ